MNRHMRTLLMACLALFLSAGACAAAKAKKPHQSPAACHGQDCRSAAAPPSDPELGIHGHIGAGASTGFVGSQGQAGFNW
jgi:hypothetical protein